MELNLESICFGQRHPTFGEKDFEVVRKIKRLALKHNRLCLLHCNGGGWIKGKFYRLNNPDGYVNEEQTITIFETERNKIEEKIKALIKDLPSFSVKYQYDPRGKTVKLFYKNEQIEI